MKHEWIDGTKKYSVTEAVATFAPADGTAPPALLVNAKPLRAEILRLAAEAERLKAQAGRAYTNGKRDERKRLRPLLERCLHAAAKRRPSNPGSILEHEQLLADLRRELGHPTPPPE